MRSTPFCRRRCALFAARRPRWCVTPAWLRCGCWPGASGCAALPLARPRFGVRVWACVAGRCQAAALRQPASSTQRCGCVHPLPPHAPVRPSRRTACPRAASSPTLVPSLFSRLPRALPAVAQVVQDQAHPGQEAEAEPPDPAVDPPAHGQHHPVRCGDGLVGRRLLRRCGAALRSLRWWLRATVLPCTLAFRPPAARFRGRHCALGLQRRNWPLCPPHVTHACRPRAPQLQRQAPPLAPHEAGHLSNASTRLRDRCAVQCALDRPFISACLPSHALCLGLRSLQHRGTI